MKWLLALLLWQALSDPTIPEQMRYERPLLVQGAGQACAPIDPMIFPHAAPSLRDLRLYAAGREIPYAMTLSQSAEDDDDTAEVRNLVATNGSLTFDLVMPDRPYSAVKLNLGGRDFTVTAHITADGRSLGTFTLFDMTTEHLARQTTVALEEAQYPLLHLVLTGNGPMPSVLGADVPPSREAQMIYTSVAKTTSLSRRGKDSVAIFRIPRPRPRRAHPDRHRPPPTKRASAALSG